MTWLRYWRHPVVRFVAVMAALLLALLWVVGAGTRNAERACAREAARVGLPHWTLGERLICLGSRDGQQWVVLRP